MTDPIELRQLALRDFRGFRGFGGTDDWHRFQIEAEIVLVTGKNGAGKSSLFQAICLLLNGWDPALFAELSLVNRKMGAKSAALQLNEVTQGDFTEEEWKTFSPLGLAGGLKPELARAASSLFAEQIRELACGRLDEMLGGLGNDASNLQGAMKSYQSRLKELGRNEAGAAQQDLPHKKVLEQLVRLKDASYASAYWDKFENFAPLLRNQNLSKTWEDQLIHVAALFGLPRLPIGPSFFVEFIRKLDKRLADLGPPPSSEQDWPELLRQIDGYMEQHGLANIALHAEPVMAETLRQVNLQLDQVAEKTRCLTRLAEKDSLGRLLAELAERVPQVRADLDLLSEQTMPPFPLGLVGFAQKLGAMEFDYLIKLWDAWSGDLARLRQDHEHRDSELRRLRARLEEEERFRKALARSPQGQRLLELKGGIARGHLQLELKAADQSQRTDVRDEFQFLTQLKELLVKLEVALLEVKAQSQQPAEPDPEAERRVKERKEWASLLSKESDGGRLSKILQEREMGGFLNLLKGLLSIFHFPPSFVTGLEMRQKTAAVKKRQSGQQEMVPHLGEVDFGNLSTGQKATFALCWTAALNQWLYPRLGHKLLLFDDILTHLDFNQLGPACLLFRKLAYAENPGQRRQIFVSCHNEEITNRLLDFLLPPPNFRLQILEFKDFDAERGPKWESWQCKPAASPK